MKDPEIIELFFARSEDAISETDKKYGAYCRAISGNILADSRDAEECVSDSYLCAWNNIPPERPVNFRVWLGRIVRNISINRFGKNSAGKRGIGQLPSALSELEECLSGGDGIEEVYDSRDITSAINTFLRALPEEKRTVFIRRYWYLDPVEKIAGALGLTENKVSIILYRSRKLLKDHLESEGIYL